MSSGPLLPTKAERKALRVREIAWRAAESRSRNKTWMAGFVAGALWYRATSGNIAEAVNGGHHEDR